MKDIGCGEIQPNEVHACHRLKNKKDTIIRFVCRKNADNALHFRGGLKDIDKGRYGITDKVYINESLCQPMSFLTWKVRSAKRDGKIDSYNYWKGKLTLKMGNSEYQISHIEDLIFLGLAEREEQSSFIKQPLKFNK